MNKQLKPALTIGAAVIAACLTGCTIAVPPPNAMMYAPAPFAAQPVVPGVVETGLLSINFSNNHHMIQPLRRQANVGRPWGMHPAVPSVPMHRPHGQ